MKCMGLTAALEGGWHVHVYSAQLKNGSLVWGHAGHIGWRLEYGQALLLCRDYAQNHGLDASRYEVLGREKVLDVQGSLVKADPFKLAILRASLEAASSGKE